MNTTEPHTQDPLGRYFCGKCGYICSAKIFSTYYDNKTGLAEYHWIYTCPNHRWWKQIIEHHTHFRCDDKGNTYAYEI